MPAVQQQQLRMGPELAVAVAMLKLVKKAGTHVLRMRWCGVTRAHWGLRLSSLLIPAAPTLPPSSPPHLRHALMATCFACMRPLAPRPASHVPFACMPRPAGHVPVACMPRPRTPAGPCHWRCCHTPQQWTRVRALACWCRPHCRPCQLPRLSGPCRCPCCRQSISLFFSCVNAWTVAH